MRVRRLLLLPPLFVLLVTTQISCSRLKSSSESSPAAPSSPSAHEIIDQILNRYEKELGGKEAIDAITSYKLKGSFELLGMSGTMEGWRKEPHKTLSVIHFPRLGTMKKGFDGETHWVQTPAGTFTESEPQEIAEMERDQEAFSASKIRSLFETLKLEHKARLSGRDVYVIEGKPAQGPAEKLFFDVENGLLLRWDMARRRPKRGTVFVKVHFEDYRQVAGVKVPFKLRFAFESFNFNVKVDELQHNVAIDDAIFRKP